MSGPKTDVLVAVADEAFFPYVRALFSGARRRGGWRGDFALITAPSARREALAEWRQRGVHVLRGRRYSHPGLGKLHLSEPFFQSWKRLLYLDCDVMVCADMSPLVALEGLAFCDPEPYSAREHFSMRDLGLYEQVCGLLPPDARGFNAGAMLLDASLFKNRITPAWARRLRKRFRPINRRWGGRREGDQPILNILLAGLWQPFPNHEVIHWDKAMRPATCALHFCPWRAPWKSWPNKQHSEFFGREFQHVHREDAAAFEACFPVADTPGRFFDATLAGRVRRVLDLRLRRG